MRHQHGYRTLNRKSAHRRSMFRNMVTSLVMHERCETTIQKAKELRPIAEKFVTLAGNDTLAARRKAYSYLFDKKAVHKLFAELGPRYKTRPGGYTRILRNRIRVGDAAEMAVIEFVTDEAKPAEKTKSKAKAGSAKKTETKKTESKTADSEIVEAKTDKKSDSKKGSSKKAASKKTTAKKLRLKILLKKRQKSLLKNQTNLRTNFPNYSSAIV